MKDKIAIPYNDVFFYGLTMRSRDITDIKGDIFSNILMRYLNSLKPVTNRLYRVADNDKYEYSYSFVPTKPISWRVIKNRRVIEDIEQMSDGKYCLNYYDDNGNDVKRVIYSNHHKWFKTNYYNSVYSDTLVCSIVPKELNGQTVILQYITGEPYPVTLHCCPLASNMEVMQKVLSRVPEPEVTALTNYGLLYFAQEETLKLYNQVLSEEEQKYAEAHKPQVFNTEQDVAGGFCFDAESFDSTKNTDSLFDLQSADELTEEGFDAFVPQQEEVILVTDSTLESDSTDEYSIDKDIADAIRAINEATNLTVDSELIFADNNTTSDDAEQIPDTQQEDIHVIEELAPDVQDDSVALIIDDVQDTHTEDTNDNTPAIDITDIVFAQNEMDTTPAESIPTAPDFASPEVKDGLELLTMDDDAIDDYVSTLIDSILLQTQEAAGEYLLHRDDNFIDTLDQEATNTPQSHVSKCEDYINDNTADVKVESNGADYYYYGPTDENGNRFGRGRTLMSDGKTAYEGDYLEDMRHGVGSFYYKDGSLCYWGGWAKNQREGFGVGVSSETGVTHIGSWQQNKPVGIGVRFDKDGNFMYIDSASHKTNGGIRITGFTENSIIVEVWDDKTLKIIKKEISL